MGARRRGEDALFGESFNAQRAAVGLPQVDNVRDYVFTDRPWVASDPILSPWLPTDLCDVVQTGAWILRDARPLSAKLQAFLDAGAPPVYVGFGSIKTAPDVARTAIEAVRAQGHRILLARGWANLAAIDDRDDCLVVGEVNQQALFPRVAELGIGVAHDGAVPTFESLSAALGRALAPALRTRTGAVAAMMRSDGAKVAAEMLVALTSARGSPE